MTGTSFNYIYSQIVMENYFCPEYSAELGLEKNIGIVAEKIHSQTQGQEFVIIGHSLGGLIGLGIIHELKNCTKLITMSTPWGGSMLANVLSITMPYSRLMADINTHNRFRRELISQPLPIPTMCLVSTAGNSPFNFRENDGVVSIESQEELAGATFVHLPVNHYEILLDHRTVTAIEDFL